MNQDRLRDRLSVFLLCGQLAIPIMVLLAYLSDGFTREEWTQLNEITMPMVAAFGSFAITHIVRSKTADGNSGGKQLTPLFVGAAVGLPALFLICIAAVIGLKAFNLGIKDFEDLKAALATLNTLLGASSGTLMASLFEKE